MFSASVQDALQKLYVSYIDDRAPLITLLEVERQKFPVAILNEVRALNDHVARTYQQDLTDKECLVEIDSASRHLDRIRLDCLKHLCVGAHDEILKVRKDYDQVRLAEVDNGRFLPELGSLHRAAQEKFRAAKVTERSGKKQRQVALDDFESAYLAFVLR